jgi:hypothetical protein
LVGDWLVLCLEETFLEDAEDRLNQKLVLLLCLAEFLLSFEFLWGEQFEHLNQQVGFLFQIRGKLVRWDDLSLTEEVLLNFSQDFLKEFIRVESQLAERVS